MRFSEAVVDITGIRDSDTTFRITTDSPVDNLAASIGSIGLLHPPVLQLMDSHFRIVCGFRRIRALRKSGARQVPARILDSDATRLDCVRWAVTDNSFQRRLTLMEQSRAILLLDPLFPDPAALATEAGRLGLPEHIGMIRKLKRLARLPETIRDLVDSEAISLSMALELERMEPIEAMAMAELFDGLKIGLNRQRELLILLQEIAGRDQKSILDLLNDTPLQDILRDPSRDRPQKAMLVREYLRKKRYPAITRNEAEFQHRVQELNLATGIRLIPPAGFEGTDYQFFFSFHDIVSLRNQLASLEHAADHEAMAAILRRWEFRDG
jgi:ParB-like chromosome segregation protein Spo0J